MNLLKYLNIHAQCKCTYYVAQNLNMMFFVYFSYKLVLSRISLFCTACHALLHKHTQYTCLIVQPWTTLKPWVHVFLPMLRPLTGIFQLTPYTWTVTSHIFVKIFCFRIFHFLAMKSSLTTIVLNSSFSLHYNLR